MGEAPAIGLLAAVAVLLLWAGLSGRAGLVLAAVVAPGQLQPVVSL